MSYQGFPQGVYPQMVGPPVQVKKNTGWVVALGILGILLIVMVGVLVFFLTGTGDKGTPSEMESMGRPEPSVTTSLEDSEGKGSNAGHSHGYTALLKQLDGYEHAGDASVYRDDETVYFRSSDGYVVCTISMSEGTVDVRRDKGTWIERPVEQVLRDDEPDLYIQGINCEMMQPPPVDPAYDKQCGEESDWETEEPLVAVGGSISMARYLDGTSSVSHWYCASPNIEREIVLDTYEEVIPGLGVNSRLQAPVLLWREKVDFGGYICGFEQDEKGSGPVVTCVDTQEGIGFQAMPRDFRVERK
ncbi:MAG: hypothetical protein Q4G30_01485 [Actinomycetaceae bacterium]|nr:hypothetical protein [Actinomycetaceae bacterium]